MKRIMTKVLALVMVLTMLPTIVFGESFSDMPNDWSSEALSKAVENGLLTGYNGKLMPEANLTRAQMAAIINRAFGSYASGSLESYTDVPEGKWYRNDIAKAVQMKTFIGSGNMLNPESNITREEAFIVMARAMKLDPSGITPIGFNDLDEVSMWAKADVYALINAGYVKGSNGMINPKGSITRAEFAQLMHNMIKNYINTAGEYTETVEGNLMVNVPGVVLKGLTVNGDLIVGEGVAEGNLVLDNVEIKGRLVVRGGGINSIIVKNSSSIDKAIMVTRYDGAVRVVFEDGTEVDAVYVEDGEDKVIIEGTVASLVINSDVPIEVNNAEIKEIKVNVPAAKITVDENSKVDGILVYAEAEGAKIVIDGQVTSLVTAAQETSISGDGKVTILEVMASASKTVVDVEATDIVVAKEAEDVILPEEPAIGGGGGGGGAAPYEALTLKSASLNGTAAVISADSISVNMTYTTSYAISANFNKPVKITGITIVAKGQTGVINIGVPIDNGNISLASGEKSKNIPVSYGTNVSATLVHTITSDHLDKFGDSVEVTVTDGTNPKTFTITLVRPQK